MTNCIQYGTGVIGRIRGYFDKKNGEIHIFRLTEHIDRFLKSLRLIGVFCDYTNDELRAITINLIKKNKPKTNIYIGMYGYAGSQNMLPNLAKDKDFKVSIYILGLDKSPREEKGLSAGISSWRRNSDNSIPSRGKLSGGYMGSALAAGEANKQGFDQAIMLGEHGHVAEGPTENIFIVRDKTLITPAKNDDILEGITRRSILELANDIGIKTEERSIDRSELYISDEIFFTGTATQIAWIKKVDGRTIGSGEKGPLTKKLQDLFFKVVYGEEKKYDHWRTTIKI